MFTTDNIEIIIHKMLGFICHQDPSLVLSVQGHSLPLCPRCIGMHSGFLLAIVCLLFINKSTRHRLISINPIVLLLPASVMGIEWLLSNLNLYDSSNISRLLSGFIGGVSFGAFLVLFSNHHSIGRSFRNSKTIIVLLLSPMFIFLKFQAADSHQSYWFINLALAYIVIANLIIVGTVLILRVQLIINNN